jgi:hypothetical protein
VTMILGSYEAIKAKYDSSFKPLERWTPNVLR